MTVFPVWLVTLPVLLELLSDVFVTVSVLLDLLLILSGLHAVNYHNVSSACYLVSSDIYVVRSTWH